MFLDFSKAHRSTLTKTQRDFLEKVIPWSRYIQDQSKWKARCYKSIESPYGLYASLVTADIIIASEWGTHPLCQIKYKNKLANNLSLLESNPYWTQRKLKLDDKEYKLFDDWEHFANHYSDQIVFSNHYCDLLKTGDLVEQTLMFCLHRPNPEAYTERIKVLISLYDLSEFDIYGIEPPKR